MSHEERPGSKAKKDTCEFGALDLGRENDERGGAYQPGNGDATPATGADDHLSLEWRLVGCSVAR